MIGQFEWGSWIVWRKSNPGLGALAWRRLTRAAYLAWIRLDLLPHGTEDPFVHPAASFYMPLDPFLDLHTFGSFGADLAPIINLAQIWHLAHPINLSQICPVKSKDQYKGKN